MVAERGEAFVLGAFHGEGGWFTSYTSVRRRELLLSPRFEAAGWI